MRLRAAADLHDVEHAEFDKELSDMYTYAQNFEGVMLNRLFHEQASGLYIDVGAWDPNMHSATKHFYKCGWHDVNVEPLRSKLGLSQQERPRDANLNMAVGDAAGEMRSFECMEESYLSIPDPVIADQFRARGGTVIEYTVPVVTLNETFERYCPGPVDFLKIDVEGWEKPAIESCDWRRFQPRALVIEATKPATRPASWDDLESLAMWHDWEPIILANRYVFAHFDGLNRFYVREEDAALAGRFQLPPGVLDDIRYEEFDQNQELTRLLKESEADRAARLEQIHELTRLLRNKPGRWRSDGLAPSRPGYVCERPAAEPAPSLALLILLRILRRCAKTILDLSVPVSRTIVANND